MGEICRKAVLSTKVLKDIQRKLLGALLKALNIYKSFELLLKLFKLLLKLFVEKVILVRNQSKNFKNMSDNSEKAQKSF